MSDIDEKKCSELTNELGLEEGEIVSDGEDFIDEETPNERSAAKIDSDVLAETDFELSAPKHEIENSTDNYAYSSVEDDWMIEPNANERFESHVRNPSSPYCTDSITHHTKVTNIRYRRTKKVNCDFRKSRRHSTSDHSDNEFQSKSLTRQKQMLCKFHVLGCCSKKKHCHYMHSDFPCKHYYLGLKGHDKSRCKLLHGRPLSSYLRSILLRHLRTASRDLLGDFPRYSNEVLDRKLDRRHQKLKLKYNRLESPNSYNSLSENETITVDNNDSMKLFSGVIRSDQIALLVSKGIDHIDKFSQLTISQLIEFGITIEQVHIILQKALVNFDSNNGSNQSGTLSCHDVDMRLAALRNPTHFIPKTVVQNENFKFDNGYADNQVDSEEESTGMRIDETCDSSPGKAPFSRYTSKPNCGQHEVEVTESWDDISGQNTTCPATEESELQIVDSLYSADGKKLFSVLLNQPTSDDSLFQTLNESYIPSYNETGVGDLKAAEETNAFYDLLSIPTNEGTHTILNNASDYDNLTEESISQSISIDDVSADILQSVDESLHTTIKNESTEPVNRISSMEKNDESLILNNFKSSKPACKDIDYADSLNLVIKDIELRTSNRPQSSDINSNLPFKRLQHTVADEIYASITSHPAIPYVLLWEIDIPKPNFDAVRRVGIPLEEVKDPRLRRIFSAEKMCSPDKASKPLSTMHANRRDPRLKPVPSSLSEINEKIQIALVMSVWYNNLPADKQVLANEQLDSLKLKLSHFHSNKTSDKKFDLSFVRQNILMQQVITNLGLHIDDAGLIQQKVCWVGGHTTYVFPSETRVMTLNNNYPAGSD